MTSKTARRLAGCLIFIVGYALTMGAAAMGWIGWNIAHMIAACLALVLLLAIEFVPPRPRRRAGKG